MCSGNRPSSAADPAPILSIPHLFASILVRRVPRAAPWLAGTRDVAASPCWPTTPPSAAGGKDFPERRGADRAGSPLGSRQGVHVQHGLILLFPARVRTVP